MATQRKARKGISDYVEKHASGKTFGRSESSRQAYDVKFKLAAVKYAESQSNAKAGDHFGVSECNIRRWRKDKEKLLKASSYRKAFRGPKKGRFPEVDKIVTDYCLDLRSRGLPVTTLNIQMKAGQAARDLGLTQSQFKASYGWVRRFMKRNNFLLKEKDHTCSKTS